MLKIILDDLKAEFPGVKNLTIAQVAKLMGKSSAALYKLKDRGKLTLKFKKEGGSYMVTIYDFAQWLAEDGEAEEKDVEVPKNIKPPKGAQLTKAGLTFRTRAPMSKTLFNCFMANIQQIQEEALFYGELFRELEAIELSRLSPEGNIKARRKVKL